MRACAHLVARGRRAIGAIAAVAVSGLVVGLPAIASATPTSATTAAPSPYVAIAGFGSRGYWLVQANGEVVNHGHAPFYGSLPSEGIVPNAPIVAIVIAAHYSGYWLVGADGGVYAFGGAHFYGSLGGQHLAHPIIGMAGADISMGYSLVDSDGAWFGFGAARFGGFPAQNLAAPLVAPLVALAGQYTVSANGAIFGGAPRFGSMAGRHLNAPIVGMGQTRSLYGYWEVAADGGVFSFGKALYYGGGQRKAVAEG